MHRAADRLVSAEAERDVRKAAGDVAAGTGFADDLGCLDEIERIGVVLRDRTVVGASGAKTGAFRLEITGN